MKAIVLTKTGGPEVLKVSDVPDPTAGDHDCLIRIQRAYEAVSQMISNTSDLSKSAIQRLGSVQ